MDGSINCPKCGSPMKVRSESNPIRRVIREHMQCSKCGHQRVVERPPDVTLAEWLKSMGLG